MPAEHVPGRLVSESAWPEVEAELATGASALLPVGAAAKAHGRHLPMSADCLQAEWLARALVRRTPVVAWPVVSYGYYPAFTAYPGSISLSAETFRGLIEEILLGIQASGARRTFVLNTGISTIAPLERASAGHPGVELLNVYAGPCFRATAGALETQPRGGHADEIETSILLAIAPRQVDLHRARAWTERVIGPGRYTREDPASRNYSPDGVYGDPTLATPNKGERLLAAILEDLLERIVPAGHASL